MRRLPSARLGTAGPTVNWGPFPRRAAPLLPSDVGRLDARQIYEDGVLWSWTGRGEPDERALAVLDPWPRVQGENARDLLASGQAACWLRVRRSWLGTQAYPIGGCDPDSAKRCIGVAGAGRCTYCVSLSSLTSATFTKSKVSLPPPV
ncbi:MAG: hypothetical protein EP330_25795 [Deltaproteobacteria bacterium]|nr:MAG: hypothetical protein EP330_25795 [Deltaproteobacteria bacterium]